MRPETAASVNTRVVSWNEAAEMNELVCRLALVMPCNTGRASAGRRPSLSTLFVFIFEFEALDLFSAKEASVSPASAICILRSI